MNYAPGIQINTPAIYPNALPQATQPLVSRGPVFLKREPLHYPRTLRAVRATFRLDSPVKNPPFQTPSKLGHPSYPNAPKSRSLKPP